MDTEKNLFQCHNVEGTCKHINLNPDIANKLTGDDILYQINETFKITRTENGFLIK